MFAATREQLQIPLTGLVPVIHGFLAVQTASLQDVDGRDKSDQVPPRGTLVVSVISGTCSRLRQNAEPDNREPEFAVEAGGGFVLDQAQAGPLPWNGKAQKPGHAYLR